MDRGPRRRESRIGSGSATSRQALPGTNGPFEGQNLVRLLEMTLPGIAAKAAARRNRKVKLLVFEPLARFTRLVNELLGK